MENKRTIGALAEMKGRVYVYLSNGEIGRKFTERAKIEGFTFSDGKAPTERDRGYETIMAVNPDKTLNYVGTNGRIAFGGGFKTVGGKKLIKVDFEKYISGEKDYFCV